MRPGQDASRTGYAEAKGYVLDGVDALIVDASRTGYAEAKSITSSSGVPILSMQAAQATLRQRPRALDLLWSDLDASRTGYAEAKMSCEYWFGRRADASRTGYCARQKQTSAARQEIFECVEKQNQWH